MSSRITLRKECRGTAQTAPGVADHVRSVFSVTEDTCPVRFCGRTAAYGCLGMCQRHYQQQHKHGVAYEKLPKVALMLLRCEIVGDCWLWRGARRHEYGETFHGGKKLYPHRLMYELVIGPIPEGQVVRHSCDTPLCVRPEHLRLGTQAENIADMAERGRWRNQSAAGPNNDPTAWTRKKRATL